jgi:hypothetical protein
VNRRLNAVYIAAIVFVFLMACRPLAGRLLGTATPVPITRVFTPPPTRTPRPTSTPRPTATPSPSLEDLLPTPLPAEDWGETCAYSAQAGKVVPALTMGQEIELKGYLYLQFITLVGDKDGVPWAQVGFRPVAFDRYRDAEFDEACELLLRLDYIKSPGPNRIVRFNTNPALVLIMDKDERELTGFGSILDSRHVRVKGFVCASYAASELGANAICVEELELLDK